MILQVDRAGADRWFKAAQELTLLAMLTAAPWAFGAEEPAFQGALLAGVAAFTLLGGFRLVLSDRLASWNCPVALALAALLLLCGLQLIPMPPAWLKVISPSSNQLFEELTPDRHESFIGESSSGGPESETWRPISLNPPGTRWFLIQLLALFLVAVIVRHQLAGLGFFRRLRWTAFLDGSALSLFALAQSASSPANTVYWSFPTEGSVFGPFICRNHFPFYLSLCIGLSVGLLTIDRQQSQPSSLLQDPRRLWILCGLALMGVACLFSLSRGGIASMAIAALFVGLIAWRQLLRRRSLILPAVGLSLAAMLAGWLGIRSVENRLATLEQPGIGMNERLTVWRNVLPHLARFPLFGSGNGSFALMEPIYRTESSVGDFYFAEFAHNEYLEAAFEGGLLRLSVTVALVIAVVVTLSRAIRTNSRPPNQLGLIGGLWGMLTVAIHSAVDFGMHMPAIALLATVVAVELISLTARSRVEIVASRPIRWTIALLTLAISALLANEGISTFVAEHYRQQAAALSNSGDESDRDRQFEYWETALLWRPRDAQLQQSAGQAYLKRLDEIQQQDERRDRLMAARRLIAARDLCPLLADAQYQLAEVTDCFAYADRPEKYLERAALLRPAEPAIWYELGRRYRDAGEIEQARLAWKRCLKLSDRYLPRILNDARGLLSFEQIRDQLLPPRPETWLAAADLLLPKSGADERRPFLEHALRLLEARGDSGADAVHRKAIIQRELRLFPEAVASFRLALRLAPKRHDWRIELVRMLRQLRRPAEAKSELEIILAQDPDHREASELVLIVTREMQLLGGREHR